MEELRDGEDYLNHFRMADFDDKVDDELEDEDLEDEDLDEDEVDDDLEEEEGLL